MRILCGNLGEKYNVEVTGKKNLIRRLNMPKKKDRYPGSGKKGICDTDGLEKLLMVNCQWSVVKMKFLPKTHHSPLTTHNSLLIFSLLIMLTTILETTVMNFFRGTGLQGLQGIPVAYQHIRRPLLLFWKEELIQFAKENDLEFVKKILRMPHQSIPRNLF